MIRRSYIFLCVLLAGSALGAQQRGTAPPTPTFRVQVESIEVGVRVTDAEGRFVANLTEDDFEIREDGKPQPITTLSLVDIPVSRPVSDIASSPTIEPDVTSNERLFSGRVYIMLLDELHVAPLRTNLVRVAARKFIDEHLGPDDVMAVVHMRGRDRDSQGFTSNKRLLRAAADTFVGEAVQSPVLASYQQYMRASPATSAVNEATDPFALERMSHTYSTLRELQQVSEWFGTYVRGRKKSILFISEGLTAGFFGPDGLSEQANEVIRAASRANVSIYSIDPRGLTDLADEAIELGGLKPGDDPRALRGITARGLGDELRAQNSSLRTLADDTGGIAVVSTNNFKGLFERIVEANSSYYVLSYSPTNPKRDGKFHSVSVRVKRPGLRGEARKGYTAARRDTRPQKPRFADVLSPDARVVLDNPLQTNGMRMQIFAAPFKGADDNATVVIGTQIRGADLRLSPPSRLQMSYFAADARGEFKGVKIDAFNLDLDQKTQAAVAATTVRDVIRLSLPPGRYQLRVVADPLGAGNVSSVYQDLEVPDFQKPPLAISGLLVTSMTTAQQPILRADDGFDRIIPSAPVATRVFPRGDQLAALAEIYDNIRNVPHRVTITTTITAQSGTVLFRKEEVQDSSALQGSKGGYTHAINVGLTNPAPGPYVLKIEARSSLGDSAAVIRQVPFEIAAR